MKRDLDLIREVLQAMESHEHGFAPDALEIEGYSKEQIGFHVHLAGQADLLDVASITTTDDGSPIGIPIAIRWQGYEFLEASRSEGVWSKAKQAAGATGGMAFEVLKSVLLSLATDYAKRAVGIP